MPSPEKNQVLHPWSWKGAAERFLTCREALA
jgi:hypothetical protein